MFAALERKLEEKAAQFSDGAKSVPPATSGSSSPDGAAIEETDEERLERLHAEDQAAVEQELRRYMSDGLDVQRDPLSFWNDRLSRARYPLLYQVALTMLAVQASSVGSERVFSSSKETDTLRRTGLSGAMMEILQVLKFSLKSRRREHRGRHGVATAVELHARERLVDADQDAAQLLQPGHMREFLRRVHEAHGDLTE